METDSGPIQFILNGKRIQAKGIETTRSVLNYLRYELGLTGTKEGCAEGDCGACTIVIAELVNNELELHAVNSCIQFLPTLHGKALYTVEYLRQKQGDLHPVQKAMVDTHGSQCGFCTPGFIMSLWNVYLEHKKCGSVASDQQLRTALSGNLCRCTGYKPILEAGKQMFDLPAVDFDFKLVIDQLKALQSDLKLEYWCEDKEFLSPISLQQLTALKAQKSTATILAGCTDIGLWVNKQFRELDEIIYIGNVAELKKIEANESQLYIGAGVSLNKSFAAISKHYPQINQQWERFASMPIRNAGTLGGNIANGSPIGDSMPWLICLGASVKLTSATASRTIFLEDFYLDYMKKDLHSDEVVEAVIVPLNQPELIFRTYKLSKRYDSDISAVCAAFAITLGNNAIKTARVAFGGMAATPKRATLTESKLINQVWNESTAKNAMQSLASDFSPLSDMRASSENRLKSAENLLYRFYLETRIDDPLNIDQLSVFETV